MYLRKLFTFCYTQYRLFLTHCSSLLGAHGEVADLRRQYSRPGATGGKDELAAADRCVNLRQPRRCLNVAINDFRCIKVYECRSVLVAQLERWRCTHHVLHPLCSRHCDWHHLVAVRHANHARELQLISR